MKALPTLLATALAAGVLVTAPAVAADGNTRAPADTPQDRASDRHVSPDVYQRERRSDNPQGGTAGAREYEGRTGATPRTSNPRAGEFGSGGAQTGDLPASKGGADNALERRSPSREPATPRQRTVPEYP